MEKNSPIKICIVDDHRLFLDSLKGLVSSISNFNVIEVFNDGDELVTYLKEGNEAPDIVLLDVKMKRMDGIATCAWVKENYPEIKALALSMEVDEDTVLKMLRAGAKGYLLKDIHPNILEHSINEVHTKGFYYTENITSTLLNSIDGKKSHDGVELKEREIEFLKLACSERTYKEIASEMCLSPRTIDNYREILFQKINCKTRIGLVLYAIKEKIVIL
ncbi:two component transcriptional regulator, LuxR family [Lutibacter oricola]|uniref:Two component transcriptional regulator, LuxR family n=1 Tax=Lutibacter oricola TaxID=762486 RepID=A0A1H2QMG1_9FLAO|nr:response regulator transcription factor [Lutibacter oricola]SDW08346.1 two component transcriptional regulator, LuxR family [Lutibacter oricola]